MLLEYQYHNDGLTFQHLSPFERLHRFSGTHAAIPLSDQQSLGHGESEDEDAELGRLVKHSSLEEP